MADMGKCLEQQSKEPPKDLSLKVPQSNAPDPYNVAKPIKDWNKSRPKKSGK